MTASSDCPEPAQLAYLLSGRLPDDESERLERHLLSCESCQRQTRALNPSDTIADAIRKQAATPITKNDTQLLKALQSNLRQHSRSSLQQAELEQTPISKAQSPQATRESLTEFLPTLRPAQSADELGRLGEFRLLNLLGYGGMGAVFLAEDVRLKRRVAIKVLRPEFAKKKDAAERFLREAQAAAAVRHDNVVTIFQVGEDNGTPFMAQELFHGESLKDCLDRERTLPIDEVLRIGGQIADGLAAAHAQGLLHRDIKPANVWLERSPVAPRQGSRGGTEVVAPSSIAGATDVVSGIGNPVAERQGYDGQGYARVKILDFGLARLEQADAQLTGSGVILGTPAYMSPEQASGEVVDARTDLFSLGVVLYRMATGEQPFQGKTTTAVLKSLAVDTPVDPRELRGEITHELSDFILRLLDKDRTRRPGSAVEVSRELTNFASRKTSSRVPEAVREANATDALSPINFESFTDDTTRLNRDSSGASQRAGKRAWSQRGMAWAVTGMASVILCGVVVVTIRTKSGREFKKTNKLAGEVDRAKARVEPSQVAKSQANLAFVAGPSPFDELDPAAIPGEERFAWQPKELVAVLGSHRQRSWVGAHSVALSGDGSLALAGGRASEGLLVDVTNGKMLPTPIPHVKCVGVSPDGKMLFWKSEGNALGLMVRSGETWRSREMSLPKAATAGPQPWDATFSLDGRWLATSVLHEVLDEVPKYSTYVWDVSVDPPQRVFELHGFKHPSFSPDGKRLAVIATLDGSYSLQVFDLGELPPKRHAVVPGMEFHRDYHFDVRPRHGFLASGQLAAIDKAGLLAVWDVSTSEPKLTAKRDLVAGRVGVPVEQFSLRPFRTGADRILLFTEGGFQTWRLNEDSIELEFEQLVHWTGGNLTDVGISADLQMLASTHINGMVRLWEFTANGFREKHPIQQQPIFPALGRRTIVMAPDGKHFVTNSEDGFQVWRLNGNTCKRLACSDTKRQLDGPIGFVSPSQFTTVGNGSPHQWRIDGDRVVSMGRPTESLAAVAANPSGLVIARVPSSAEAFSSTELSLWQAGEIPAKRLCSWTAASKGQQIMFGAMALGGGFAVSNDSRTLVTTDEATDGAGSHINVTVRLWRRSGNNSAPREVASIPSPGGWVYQLALSPDAQRLAIAERSGVSLWLLRDNRPIQLWHKPGQTYAVAFMPDGENVATSFGNAGSETEPNQIVLLSRNGELLYSRNRSIANEFNIPSAPTDLAFSPDGRHLLTANSNGTAYILRVSKLTE